MQICRFDNDRVGVVCNDHVYDVTHVLDALPSYRYPLPQFDLLADNLRLFLGYPESDASGIPLSEVSLLSPLANPGKLVAAPVNYQAHLDEAIADESTFSRAHVRKIQETGLFLKATSSLIGAGHAIEIAHADRRTDHEIELAVIIGRTCRNASRDDALTFVAAYSIGLDITIRGPEERSLRKSLDTYSVLGPWMVTADEFGDPSNHDLELSIDGELRQRANTRDLIMDVPALIEFASSFYTLQPGDVLFTGTPEGVGPIAPGQSINASISGIGSMNVKVISA
jgi:2,4-diketo-3-deoxy-L-fuconate hydrolase